MPHTLEEKYQELGELIADALPENWKEALVMAEKSGETAFTMKGWYKVGEDKTGKNFVLGPKITQLLMEIRHQITDPETPSKITYSIDRSGEFRIDLDY